jgi:hypothetical protein
LDMWNLFADRPPLQNTTFIYKTLVISRDRPELSS